MYRTPRNWRWWFTVGINPQARHDVIHYRPLPLTVIFDRIGQAITDALIPTFRNMSKAFEDLGNALVTAFQGPR